MTKEEKLIQMLNNVNAENKELKVQVRSLERMNKKQSETIEKLKQQQDGFNPND